MTTEVTLDRPAEYFELLDRAESSHWWSQAIEHVESRWVRSAIEKDELQPRTLDWLDVGCGTGMRLRRWSDWGCWGERVGVEPEPSALAAASGRSGIAFVAGGLPGLPPLGKRFDLITSFDVIQHVSPEGREAAVRELAESLKPGGWLLLRTNGAGWFGRSNGDTSVVDARWLSRTIEDIGLKVLRRSHFNACGSLVEELLKSFRKPAKNHRSAIGPLKTGLPNAWAVRPRGHVAARWVGVAESRFLGTGLVKFPFGHSYLVLASKDGSHDRTTNG